MQAQKRSCMILRDGDTALVVGCGTQKMVLAAFVKMYTLVRVEHAGKLTWIWVLAQPSGGFASHAPSTYSEIFLGSSRISSLRTDHYSYAITLPRRLHDEELQLLFCCQSVATNTPQVADSTLLCPTTNRPTFTRTHCDPPS